MKETRVYMQTGDGPIFSAASTRPLVEGRPTWVLVNHIMRAAETTARVSGAVAATVTEDVFGVDVRAEWKKEDPAREEAFEAAQETSGAWHE